MVHTAAGFARMTNRLATLACTTSIGPGATNMVTGGGARDGQPPARAAAARRHLRDPGREPGAAAARGSRARTTSRSTTASSPVSRYWDRDQPPRAAPVERCSRAMRVLTDPAETGAVTLALPQDVQAEAWDWPERAVRAARLARARGRRPSRRAARRGGRARPRRRAAADRGRRRASSTAKRPTRCARSPSETGIPVVRDAGRQGLAALRPPAARSAPSAPPAAPRPTRIAREADVVIGDRHALERLHDRLAHRCSRNRGVRFVNLNVAPVDAAKHAAACRWSPTRGQASRRSRPRSRAGRWATSHRERARALARGLGRARRAALTRSATTPLPAQSRGHRRRQRAISEPRDVVVCAAGSMPGDLHKLWRTRDPKGYHVEYGYSCMGYEIAGGARRQAGRARPRGVRDGRRRLVPDDGPGDRRRPCRRAIKLTIVLVQNHGFASIGGLSEAVGSNRFGTRYRHRDVATGMLDGDRLPIDLAANAASLGADVISVANVAELEDAWPWRALRSERPSFTWRPIRSSGRRAPRRGGTCRSQRCPRSVPRSWRADAYEQAENAAAPVRLTTARGGLRASRPMSMMGREVTADRTAIPTRTRRRHARPDAAGAADVPRRHGVRRGGGRGGGAGDPQPEPVPLLRRRRGAARGRRVRAGVRGAPGREACAHGQRRLVGTHLRPDRRGRPPRRRGDRPRVHVECDSERRRRQPARSPFSPTSTTP